MKLYPASTRPRSKRDVLKGLQATLDDTWSCYYSFPEGISYRLSENCRNTRAIARSCGQVIGLPIKRPRFCPDGVKPELRSFSDEVELRKSCAALLRELALPPSRVALLSRYKPANSALKTDPLGPYSLVEDVEAWMAGKGSGSPASGPSRGWRPR